MNRQKAEKILFVYNWVRILIIVAFLVFTSIMLARMQPADYKIATKELRMVEKTN